MNNTIALQEIIERDINAQAWSQAHVSLGNFWYQNSTHSNAAWIVKTYKGLTSHLALFPLRVAILRSFTLEPSLSLLQAEAFVNGIDLVAYIGDFNTYMQDIINPSSNLYGFLPDVVILAVQTCDVAPELWSEFSDLTAEKIQDNVDRVLDLFKTCIQSFRINSQAHLVIHMLEQPATPSQGILDIQVKTSQVRAIQEINDGLRNMVHSQKGIYLLDYDTLVSRYGRIKWHDESKWLSIRMPIATNMLIHLVREWMCFIRPLTGKICKALVLDLDNTLWGGVVGEDGLLGIKLGVEYPGNVYLAFQRVILDLYQRGIILAICSKNNYQDAIEVFENHPNILLRQKHFAAMRINWQDKASNLREIAAELNIGLDSIAFLDDSPVERALIQKELPEVTVINIPSDPVQYANVLRGSSVFERLKLSAEDLKRNNYYVEDRQRKELLEKNTNSIDTFFYSLQMHARINSVSQETIMRAAQLTQKTNQFNLTTQRYTEQQISEFVNAVDYEAHTIQVHDRFGDNGIIGLAILHFTDYVCEIDTLLLSCRVIGRTVETALLAYIVKRALGHDVKYLRGWFFSTPKNLPASAFYSIHGFKEVQRDGSNSLWELDLSEGKVDFPEWITISAI